MVRSKQWLTKQNGIPALFKGEQDIPEAKAEEVLVKIKCVSLNYRDTEVVMGLYNHHQTTGNSEQAAIVPCADMVGEVVQSNSKLWKVGDRVVSIFNQTHLSGQIQAHHMRSGLGSPLPGVLTEYRIFPEYGLVKAPNYLSDEEASTLPIACLTAWMAINGFRPIGQAGGKGETILIQGTGGVAISGLQIAKASGANAIVTSSSDAKLKQAQALGADHLINYKTNTEWEKEVLSATKDEGADIIFENGGAQTLRKSFDCVKFGGTIVCIGYLSGKEDPPADRTNANVLALKRNVTLKGLLNGPRDRLEEMVGFYEQHKIKPVVNKVFAFDQAKEAFEYLFSGSHFGKVVIKVA